MMTFLVTAAPSTFIAAAQAAIDAAKGKHWGIFASALIMTFVLAVSQVPAIDNMLKGKKKVWFAACTGVLLAVGTTAFTTGNWVQAVFNGLQVGLGATGIAELIRRKIEKLPIDANNDGVLDPLTK